MKRLDFGSLVKAAPWLLIGVGIVLRVNQYVFNRSLWLDEAMLALNIIARPLAGLLQPLEFDQGAPLGFLVVEKLAIEVFGNSEYALRLFPLAAGLAALFLFNQVARDFVEPRAALIALALFAVLDPLVYYASEAKQYSSDIAIVLLVYWLALSAERRGLPARWLLAFAVAAAIAVWFSHPAIFVVTGIGVTWFAARATRRDSGAVKRLAVTYIFVLASFGVSYLVSLATLSSNQTLLDDWRGFFMPFPPISSADVQWPINTFFEIFNDPAGLTLSGLAAFLFLVGGAALMAEDRIKFWLLLAPVAITLFASALHKYPFGGRLIMFMVPSLLLLIAQGAARLSSKTSNLSPVVGIAVILLLFYHPATSAARHLVRPQTAEEIKPVLRYVEQRRAYEDVVYVYYSAQYAFRYYIGNVRFEGCALSSALDGGRDRLPSSNLTLPNYAPTFNLGERCVIGVKSRKDASKYLDDLARLRGAARVWVLFSHVYDWGEIDEEQFYLDYLDRIGTRRDAFSRPGASVYLYDLSGGSK